jgi:2-polyprenyl-3-methyl-5-hydroxy-6-metoxy-1,4-benzoquinol methylase
MAEPPQIPPFICPTHGERLASSSEQLRCPAGHAFPISGGVARFVESDGYAEAFGRQWNRFRLTQLDSHTGVDLSRRRALRCLGLEPTAAEGRLTGRTVLEVGCGAGRFTEVLLALGAAVASVDLSAAVDANALTCPPDDRHRIAQADVRHLPFGAQSFDIVLCLGVVQHTPDPEATIRALYAQVKPGGLLVFDHYAISASTVTWLGMHAARQIVKRLPAERQLPAVKRMVDGLLPLHARVARLGRTPARALSRLSPILSYYHIHPELRDELQREWALLDTHDALTDAYKHHRSPRQVRKLLVGLGLEQVAVWRGGNGVEARGWRPIPAPPRTA